VRWCDKGYDRSAVGRIRGAIDIGRVDEVNDDSDLEADDRVGDQIIRLPDARNCEAA
jgi:hypothetical protein